MSLSNVYFAWIRVMCLCSYCSNALDNIRNRFWQHNYNKESKVICLLSVIGFSSKIVSKLAEYPT